MTETITLAHISDVHLAPLPPFGFQHWNVKRVLGFLNWQRGRRFVHLSAVADRIAADAKAQKPDHIAITGDLCNIGLPAEYAQALRWVEDIGPPERVTVIPGNHDIYVPLASDPGVRRWRAYMAGDGAGNGDRSAASGDMNFPFVRRIGPVALIGLNSAVPTPPFIAAGRLGRAQLDALGGTLDSLAREQLMRVVLIHHPPLPGQASRRRGLEDAAELEKVLRQHGAELVLHGHNHRNSLKWCRSLGGEIPVVGVATASAGRAHHGEPLARYNLYRIGEGPITVVTRGIAEPGGDVVELKRQVLTGMPADEPSTFR